VYPKKIFLNDLAEHEYFNERWSIKEEDELKTNIR
jgi:hypothetical protein